MASRSDGLAFFDGTIVAIRSDLTPASRVALALPVRSIAVDASGRVLLLHDNRIERWTANLDAVDASFVAEEVSGAEWRAIDVAPDGRIVAVGSNDRDDVLVARFHP